jgi:hypothetical protein
MPPNEAGSFQRMDSPRYQKGEEREREERHQFLDDLQLVAREDSVADAICGT